MIEQKLFGTDHSGRKVYAYTITDDKLSVTLLDRGACVQSIVFDGVDVALGYDDVAGYESEQGYLGATIGRYGNRIQYGKFTLGGKTYDVGQNEGEHHLHGGFVGYDKQFWSVEILDQTAICMSLTDSGAQTGYPGTAQVHVTFRVSENALIIDYDAVCDEDTPINLTNHTYFNLSGAGQGDILDTRLQIEASAYLPVDEAMVPHGILRKVAGTPFDFTAAKPIGRDINAQDKQLLLAGGYDHNFCLIGEGFRPVCQAYSPRSNILMTCLSDQVGLQLYVGNVLETTHAKNGGTGYHKHEGFCLETQGYPDAPNQPSFPSTIVSAGEHYTAKTAYAFVKESE